MNTIEQALAEARQQLNTLPHASAKLEADILLANAIDQPRSYLYTWPERLLTPQQQNRFQTLLARRYQGEPIAYITGHREFWGLDLMVSPAVLIPRPETERLVEIALQYIPENQPADIADLGTGSGALALALASERSHCRVSAIDSSAAALEVAERNRHKLKLANVRFYHGRWFDPLTPQQFDLVVANPPYVADGDPHLQQGDLRFEPPEALTAGADGLDDIREIIRKAPAHLKPGGWLILEHGYNQGDAVVELFNQNGFTHVLCYPDYAERERAAVGQMPESP
ncbi:MAG: peptide chain release factor N(5)-glutamine methyltransferase [Gammaproteobacteria bacterium]|jgi:release factor glutamine methyltransferase